MSLLTYLDPNSIKDASIEGIKIKDNSISSSKIDETVASKSYVDAQVKTVDDKTVALEARVTNAVQITYSDLKSLRDSGKLVTGTQYRITDYVTTTAQGNTRSAGNVFDIIVRADSENKLNEESSAIQHEGDEYFANSNLSAWKLWYCLDNDTTRFAWADSTNGKGVIYRMIDEFNNDIPYDFKNIIYIFTQSFIYTQWGETHIFSRDASIDRNIDGIQYYGYISKSTPPAWSENKCWIKEESPNTNSKLYKNDGSEISYGGKISGIKLDNYETYTFGRDKDLSKTGICYSNIILPYYESSNQTLNKIIFSSNCYNNTFRDSCYNNILDSNCYNNTFRSNCSSNSFGNGCYNNTFGNNCLGNTFGNNCYRNTFGNNCNSNTFGNSCGSNTFGNDFDSNTFGNSCGSNTFGNDCQYNTFETYCYSNTFGNDFNSNTFGSYCSYNSFGNRCLFIKFASDSSDTTKYNYYQGNHFGDRCAYILFKGEETASTSSQIQNYKFAQGLKGTSSTYLTIDGVRNLAYETKVAKNSTGEIKIYCEADLIL